MGWLSTPSGPAFDRAPHPLVMRAAFGTAVPTLNLSGRRAFYVDPVERILKRSVDGRALV